MSEAQGDLGACTVQGRVDGGWAEPTTELEKKMEKKFELSEKVRKELEQSIEEVKKTFEGKEKEIQDLKDGLCQAKEMAVREYRDSDALLSKLGD